MANTFISWSGKPALHVALALRDWLPLVVDACDPFVSEADIGSGSRWFSQIEQELEGARFGIAVLTRENLSRPWLLFEIGALAKASGKVVPFCLPPLSKEEVGGPLANIQGRDATKEDIEELVVDLAKTLGEDPEKVRRRFPGQWPDFEMAMNSTPSPEEPPPEEPDVAAQLEELIQVAKATAREVSQIRKEVSPDPAHHFARLLDAAQGLMKGFADIPAMKLVQKARRAGIQLETKALKGGGWMLTDPEGGVLCFHDGLQVRWSRPGQEMAARFGVEIDTPDEG